MSPHCRSPAANVRPEALTVIRIGRERVLAEGGRLEIASSPGRGVRMLAEIPL